MNRFRATRHVPIQSRKAELKDVVYFAKESLLLVDLGWKCAAFPTPDVLFEYLKFFVPIVLYSIGMYHSLIECQLILRPDPGHLVEDAVLLRNVQTAAMWGDDVLINFVKITYIKPVFDCLQIFLAF